MASRSRSTSWSRPPASRRSRSRSSLGPVDRRHDRLPDEPVRVRERTGVTADDDAVWTFALVGAPAAPADADAVWPSAPVGDPCVLGERPPAEERELDRRLRCPELDVAAAV